MSTHSSRSLMQWLDLLSHRSELFIEFFVEWISYVNSVTRSLKITFNWLELPGFYELLVSYFSLYKGRRTFSEEAISCPSVLSMLTEAAGLDEDPDADPQQQQQQQQQLQLQQQQQAQQRQKQQIPSKYFTACESSLLSIPDMRVINYLIRKAYTTASVFSISSLVSKKRKNK